MSRTAQVDGILDAPPRADDYSGPVLLGRLKAGRALESRRVVHVIVLGGQSPHDSTVTARCGELLPIGDVQVLSGLTGMPCEYCVELSVA